MKVHKVYLLQAWSKQISVGQPGGGGGGGGGGGDNSWVEDTGDMLLLYSSITKYNLHVRGTFCTSNHIHGILQHSDMRVCLCNEVQVALCIMLSQSKKKCDHIVDDLIPYRS